MKTFLLSEQMRNELVAYLGQRPYVEVAQCIGVLQALPETPALPPKQPDAPPQNGAKA